jgi:two-component system OmpR family sensor kinase
VPTPESGDPAANGTPVDPGMAAAAGWAPPLPTAELPYVAPDAFGPHDEIATGPDKPAIGARLRTALRPLGRLAPRSLTGRLVTGVVSLVVVLVAVTGACTYVALHSFLYDRLDQQVESAATGGMRSLFSGFAVPGTASTRPTGFVFAVLLDDSGAVLSPPNPSVAEPLDLSMNDRRRLVSGVEHPVTIRTTEGSTYRVVARPVSLQTPEGVPLGSGVAIVGVSTDEVHRTLHRLVVLEWAIGVGAILVAFLATSWGVQFSLRRLRRVTATAQEVAAELSPDGAGLDRRVPAGEPGTEVGQLADSMNTLLSAVETQFAARLANEQRMRQFLADASHELRTPLTSIRGYAELARMKRAQGETDADHLSRIESEGTRMSRLVDDLLLLARSDQGGEPVREPLDVGELVDEAVGGVRAAYPARHIEAVAPMGIQFVGDRDHLLRAVRNLVTNAAVHTRPDGPIRASAAVEGTEIVIRVADSGPGLPPEEAAHVFQRFWRADKSRTRESGGSGLGLAIVASIAAEHGGTVTFDSAVATGSTVTMRLPLSPPETNAPRTQ